MRRFLLIPILLVGAANGGASLSALTDLKPIVLDPSYNHDRFDTQPKDIIREFRAYTTSFDSDDDNNGDGTGDNWGIPEWVAYELRAAPTGQAVVEITGRLDSKHPTTALALGSLGSLYMFQERLEEAESVLARAVEHGRTSHPNDAYPAVYLLYHGKVLMKLERYQQAEAALSEAHSILEAVRGASFGRTKEAVQGLADLYDAWGKPEKATEWRAKLSAPEEDEARPDQATDPAGPPEPEPVDFSVPADFDKTGFLTSTRDGLYLVSLAGEAAQVLDSDGEPLFGRLSEINGEIFLYSRFGRSRGDLIREIDRDGHVLETIPVPNEVRGYGFAALPDSHFAILDNVSDSIHLMDGEGKLLKTVAMPRLADGRSDGHWQTTRGVVVNNNLVVSEDGFRRIFTVDLETYEVSVLRDLRAAGPRKWLGALAYDQGVYYICDSNTIFSFSGGGLLKEIVTLPKGNITGILVEGNAAWVTINHTGEIHQIDLRSGKARVITKGLRSPEGPVWVRKAAAD